MSSVPSSSSSVPSSSSSSAPSSSSSADRLLASAFGLVQMQGSSSVLTKRHADMAWNELDRLSSGGHSFALGCQEAQIEKRPRLVAPRLREGYEAANARVMSAEQRLESASQHQASFRCHGKDGINVVTGAVHFDEPDRQIAVKCGRFDGAVVSLLGAGPCVLEHRPQLARLTCGIGRAYVELSSLELDTERYPSIQLKPDVPAGPFLRQSPAFGDRFFAQEVSTSSAQASSSSSSSATTSTGDDDDDHLSIAPLQSSHVKSWRVMHDDSIKLLQLGRLPDFSMQVDEENKVREVETNARFALLEVTRGEAKVYGYVQTHHLELFDLATIDPVWCEMSCATDMQFNLRTKPTTDRTFIDKSDHISSSMKLLVQEVVKPAIEDHDSNDPDARFVKLKRIDSDWSGYLHVKYLSMFSVLRKPRMSTIAEGEEASTENDA